MNTPWIVLGLVGLVLFAIFEARGLRHPERQNTLSRFLWQLGQKWPLSLVIWGVLIGGLSVHVAWNWCPAIMLPGQGG